MYIKVQESKFVTFMILYVDDMLIIGNITIMISYLKRYLQMNFKMIDLGLLYYFLRLEVWHNRKSIFMS